MKFCQDHWDRLRSALEDRGLGGFIAADGARAREQLLDQLKRSQAGEEPTTAVNWDPLMSAHFAIVNNVLETVGPNAMYLMFGDGQPEAAVEGYGPEFEHRTWPRCPLCYLNLAHEVTCTDAGCSLDREHGYDIWIDAAADDQVDVLAEIRRQG